MSAKRDRVNNEMVIPFCHDVTSAAVYTSLAYDSMLNRSDPTNMLVIIMVKSWAAGGRLVVRVQDSLVRTGGTFVTFKSFASIDQVSGKTTFVGQADRFRRWVRVRVNTIGATCHFTIIGVLARGRREPVPHHDLVGVLSSGSSESSSSSQSSSSSSQSSSSSSSSSSSASSLGKQDQGSQQPT